MKRNFILKVTLFFLGLLIAVSSIVSFSYKQKMHMRKLKEGGNELTIHNKTHFPLNLYFQAQKADKEKYVPLLSTRKLSFPKNKIGEQGSTLIIESKKWDRPIVIGFNGQKQVFSKKLIKDRRDTPRVIYGDLVIMSVKVQWELFSKHNGFIITLSELKKAKIERKPDNSIWKRMFRTIFASNYQRY